MPDDRENDLPMEDITLSMKGVERILAGLNPDKAVARMSPTPPGIM